MKLIDKKKLTKKLYKINSKVGTAIMDTSDSLDIKARKALGKPTEIKDSHFRFVPCDDGSGNLRMVDVPPEKTAEIEANYMNQGKAELSIGKASRLVWKAGYRVSNNDFKPKVVKNLEYKKNEYLFFRELKNARCITWDSWIIARHGDTLHIDGWLTLPSGRTRQFDIVCSDSEEHWYAESISFGGAQGYADHGLHGVILPGETVTPAGIEVALRGWYMSLYEYTPDHWGYREQKLPEFVINCSWEDECSTNNCCVSDPAKEKRTDKELAKLLMADTARETFAKFGQSPIPKSLETLAEKLAVQDEEEYKNIL